MPYKDPEKNRQVKAAWRRKSTEAGYGKALYKRRSQRYQNEIRLRVAVEEALSHLRYGDPGIARLVLEQALKESPEIGPPSEYMPGRLKGDTKEQIASGKDNIPDSKTLGKKEMKNETIHMP